MVVKYLKKGTTSSIGTSPDSQWISNENLGESRSVFEFRKLIKIARNGLKIQEFSWRYQIEFGTLFMLVTSSKSPIILN
jgi:hypothetical protein